MKKTIKDRDWIRLCVSVLMSLPRAYEDPQEPGALGGVQPFAQAHKLKTPQAQRILQSVLSYTLHKPRRTRFPTTPTLVFDRDITVVCLDRGNHDPTTQRCDCGWSVGQRQGRVSGTMVTVAQCVSSQTQKDRLCVRPMATPGRPYAKRRMGFSFIAAYRTPVI